jgi:hypothetical protein
MAKPSANNRSKELQAFSTIGITLIAVALVITILAGWYASSRSVSALGESSFSRIQDSLSSYAAESQLLASEYRDHRAPNNFVKISANKLHDAVNTLADGAEEQDVEPAVAQKSQQLTNQANKLGQALSELSRLPRSHRAARLDQAIKKVRSEVSQL